jgi:DNA-binding winged helix-turn-helix (wHTH) protein
MRISFGDFVLDTGTRELCRDGQPLSLTPKAFDLLEILVTERPNVVTKSGLQERLWPDRFVVEKNLTNLICEIRDVLGDQASKPRFIRTVHRLGYAFRDRSVKTGRHDSPAPDRGTPFHLFWSDQNVPLDEGEHILGRDSNADVYLDSASVSRRHARISVSGGEATVQDLGSKNGTLVGDRRIDAATRLKDGDAIRVGSVVLTFRVVREAGSTKTETSQ